MEKPAAVDAAAAMVDFIPVVKIVVVVAAAVAAILSLVTFKQAHGNRVKSHYNKFSFFNWKFALVVLIF